IRSSINSLPACSNRPASLALPSEDVSYSPSPESQSTHKRAAGCHSDHCSLKLYGSVESTCVLLLSRPAGLSHSFPCALPPLFSSAHRACPPMRKSRVPQAAVAVAVPKHAQRKNRKKPPLGSHSQRRAAPLSPLKLASHSSTSR